MEDAHRTDEEPVTPSGVPTDPVRAAFERLREGYRTEPDPSYAARRARLERLERMLLDGRDRIADAVRADFGHRSRHESLLAEVWATVTNVRHLRSNLKSWMRPERRHVSYVFFPGAAEVRYQPVGVVGVLSPWNYPVQLAIAPLAAALAAGNRVLLKPSELTPATSELLRDLLGQAFAQDEVSVVLGGADVGAAVTRLPLDHLLYTGSTHVGRIVMRAAAENLVPVTLELGGKSPAIVHPTYDLAKAAERIVIGKLFNAGQTCIAPDYALVPRGSVDAFVAAFQEKVAGFYPRLGDNPDYTAIINDRHRARLAGYLTEAEARGARVVPINPASEDLAGTGKLAPTLVVGAPDDLAVMQDEIFGPILPIVAYDALDDALRYVNDRPRPLALYYFDGDNARTERVLARTHAGGVCVNDTLLHFAQEDLPFGGVGASGIGRYHGVEGFRTFCHPKAVFWQSRINGTGLIAPPYGARLESLVDFLLGK